MVLSSQLGKIHILFAWKVFQSVPWIMQRCWPPPQCDAVSVLEKEHDYRDEHFDFIQSHIRRFSLQCILWIVPRPLVSRRPTSYGWTQQFPVFSQKKVCQLPWRELTDGAGLIYTSVKEEKNLDLLYKYIVHKMYEFQFTTSALVVEKDAVFM